MPNTSAKPVNNVPWTITSKAKFAHPDYYDGEIQPFSCLDCPENIIVDFHVKFENDTEPALTFNFCGGLWDTECMGRMVFEIMDSYSAEDAEIAWQLYCNTRVERDPFNRGVLFCINEINCIDLEKLESKPELMRCIAEATFKSIRKFLVKVPRFKKRLSKSGTTELSMVFFGYSDEFNEKRVFDAYASEDMNFDKFKEAVAFERRLMDIFQAANFATFMCDEFVTATEGIYIAYIDERAFRSKTWSSYLNHIPMHPEVRSDDEDEWLDDDDEDWDDEDVD